VNPYTRKRISVGIDDGHPNLLTAGITSLSIFAWTDETG
jgi:hypothetical protein